MAKRGEKRLSDREVARAKKSICDGRGLWLLVREDGKRWVVRVTVGGKRREFGLGAYSEVSLAEARRKADAAREETKRGRMLSHSMTFREAWEHFWRWKKTILSNGKHIWQWEQVMTAHVLPAIGFRPVADIRPPEIIAMLEPIWRRIPETAHRTLDRVRAVFTWAIVNEVRERANPCEGVAKQLGNTRPPINGFRSLPYPQMPAFFQRLEGFDATPAKLALKFVIATVGRSGEVIGATWDEISGDLWCVPAQRMKMRKEHRVPLSDAAMAVLAEAQKLPRPKGSNFIFPGQVEGKLSDMSMTMLLRYLGVAEQATTHGFRSTFRTWGAEQTSFKSEVLEACLAHAIKNKVEASYNKATYLDERRLVMQRWADYLTNPV